MLRLYQRQHARVGGSACRRVVEDLALTIHAHPTLSETIAFAAERALGSLTDL